MHYCVVHKCTICSGLLKSTLLLCKWSAQQVFEWAEILKCRFFTILLYILREFFSHPYVAVSWCPIPDSTFQHRDKNKWVTESTQTCRNSVKSHWRLRIGPPAWCGLVSVMRTDTERLWRECMSGCSIEKHLNMSAQQGVLTYTLETLRQDGCPGTYMPTDSWHGLDSQREEYGCASVWVCVNSWKASFGVYVYFVLCNVYFFCITVLAFLKVYIEYYCTCTGLKLWFLHSELSPPVLSSNQLSWAPIIITTITMVREHLCQLTGSKQSSAIKMPPSSVSIWNCCVWCSDGEYLSLFHKHW